MGVSGKIIGPHNAHMIPATLPGAGNILVFDNGGIAGYGSLREDCLGTFPNALSDYSRVLEFNPKTYEVVWEYTQPNPTADSDGDGVREMTKILQFIHEQRPAFGKR